MSIRNHGLFLKDICILGGFLKRNRKSLSYNFDIFAYYTLLQAFVTIVQAADEDEETQKKPDRTLQYP